MEAAKQKLAITIDELKHALHIETSDKNLELRLNNELKSLNTKRKLWHVVSSVFLGGFALLAIVTLIVDERSLLGIEIKKQYLNTSILVICISTMVKFVGDIGLRSERIKSILLFNELNRCQ